MRGRFIKNSASHRRGSDYAARTFSNRRITPPRRQVRGAYVVSSMEVMKLHECHCFGSVLAHEKRIRYTPNQNIE